MSDRVLGVCGLLLAAFYIWGATLIQVSFISDPVGPKTFPMIIGGLLGLASLYMIFRPDPEPVWPTFGRLFEIAVAAALFVAYALLLPELGFLIATAVAAAFLSWRLGAGPLAAIVAGICISLGIYIIFHLVLGLSLARGPFGF